MARAGVGRLALVIVPLVVVCAGVSVLIGSRVRSLLAGQSCQAPADQEQVIAAWLSDPVLQPQLYGIQLEPRPAPTPGVSRYCDPIGYRNQVRHRMTVGTGWRVDDTSSWYPVPVLFDRVEPLLVPVGWTYAGYSEGSADIEVRFCRTIRATATVAAIGISLDSGQPPPQGVGTIGGTMSVVLDRSNNNGATCPTPPTLAGDGDLGTTAHPTPRPTTRPYYPDRGPVPHLWWFRAPALVADTATTAGGVVYVATDSPDVDNAVFALDGRSGRTRWRATVPGRVEGRLAVGDGQVYVASLLGWVVSLDATTGQQRWRALVPVGRPTRFRGQAPVIGAGMVFIGGADGRLYAVDAASGSIRWRSAPRLSLMDSSPPAVIGSTVFTVGFDHQVYALDTATGTIRWTRPTSGAGGVVAAGPVLLVEEQGGVTGVDVSAYGNQFLAVDPTSGAELWHALGDFPIPATKVPGGLLLLDRGGYVFALDRTSRAVEWQLLPSGVPDDAGPAAAQTFIQVDNTVYALNANTGATIWTADIGQYSNGQPVAADGVVVATSESSFDFDRNDVGTVFAFSYPDAN